MFPRNLHLVSSINFSVDSAMNPIMVNALDTIGEHIGISPLTKKKVKPKGSAVSDHLLLCNHSSSFENFSVLTKENIKFLLELKESLLIMRDKLSLNRNIRSLHHYTYLTKYRFTPLLGSSIFGF